MATEVAGTWKLDTSENFEELMKALGVGLIMRKVGNNTKPTVKITADGNSWEMITESAVKTQVIKFELGKEIDVETLDGRKTKSTFTLDGNKLVQTERDKDNNVTCVITRELNEKGELVAVARAGDVVSTRTYKRS